MKIYNQFLNNHSDIHKKNFEQWITNFISTEPNNSLLSVNSNHFIYIKLLLTFFYQIDIINATQKQILLYLENKLYSKKFITLLFRIYIINMSYNGQIRVNLSSIFYQTDQWIELINLFLKKSYSYQKIYSTLIPKAIISVLGDLEKNKNERIKEFLNSQTPLIMHFNEYNRFKEKFKKPFILYSSQFIYLNTFYSFEQRLITQLNQRINFDQLVNYCTKPPIEDQKAYQNAQNRSKKMIQAIDKKNLPSSFKISKEQEEAIVRTHLVKTLFIHGGPGTGKTSTAVNILRAVIDKKINDHFSNQNNSLTIKNSIRILLTAPTGKAAIRLKESIIDNINLSPLTQTYHIIDQIILGKNISKNNDNDSSNIETKTIHNLLRMTYTQKKPSQTKIDAEIIIVDESSMISIQQMTWILECLRKETFILFLGDQFQLPSIQAGSIFGDIIQLNNNIKRFKFHIIELTQTFRFHGIIKQISQSIQSGDIKAFNSLTKNCIVNELKDKRSQSFTFYLLEQSKNKILEFISNKTIWKSLYEKTLYGFSHREIKNYSDVFDELFELMNKEIILTPFREGSLGLKYINNKISSNLKTQFNLNSNYYNGIPIVIEKNDWELGLMNGDRGIICSFIGDIYAVFPDIKNKYKAYIINQLPQFELGYTMTVHKSQGSEFDHVTFLLHTNQNQSKLMSRELFYTAMTRVKKSCLLISDQNSIENTMKNITHRASGIQNFLT